MRFLVFNILYICNEYLFKLVIWYLRWTNEFYVDVFCGLLFNSNLFIFKIDVGDICGKLVVGLRKNNKKKNRFVKQTPDKNYDST